MTTKGIAEILQEVSSKDNIKPKAEELRKHSDNNALRMFLSYALHPNVEWLLPEGEPPYKPLHKDEDAQGILYNRVKKLNMFVKNGGYDHLKPLKREQLFIQLLEAVDPDDAKLLIAAKDKKIPYPGITPHMIEKAWPGFTKTWNKK